MFWLGPLCSVDFHFVLRFSMVFLSATFSLVFCHFLRVAPLKLKRNSQGGWGALESMEVVRVLPNLFCFRKKRKSNCTIVTVISCHCYLNPKKSVGLKTFVSKMWFQYPWICSSTNVVRRGTAQKRHMTSRAGTRPVPAAMPADKLRMPSPTMPLEILKAILGWHLQTQHLFWAKESLEPMKQKGDNFQTVVLCDPRKSLFATTHTLNGWDANKMFVAIKTFQNKNIIIFPNLLQCRQ